MRTFNDILNELNRKVDSMITKDTPTEQITEFGQLKDQIKELGDAHQQTLDDYGQLKDRYIDAVKSYGTSKAPENDAIGQEKTLEEIGAEIISNRGK